MDVFVVFEANKFCLEEFLPLFGAEHRARDKDVLVTAATHIDDERLVLRKFLCDFHGSGTCVSAFESKENAFVAGKELHRFQGFLVEDAENGERAVQMVMESAPGYYSAVLMDIQMPVMDGYEAARAIRELPDARLSKIPIIAMTANAFKEDEEAAKKAGMQGHIAKPLDMDAMRRTIMEVLGGQSEAEN